jgi:predicted nucleotidyltransferase component of viral defense system
MPADFLHNHPQFPDLIRIVAQQKNIDPALVEKDHWIMHCLYGLQQLGLTFELKGGTSLSKGFQVIDRFSEDIDIRIEPPGELHVKTGRNQTKLRHVESRRNFYEWLAKTIRIDGITKVEGDTAFDTKDLFSAGIRLSYNAINKLPEGLREGVLLEVGFDDVTPNIAKDISSWAYDHAVAQKVDLIDNRAKGVACYDPRYTFVEKLQTISTKYRRQQAGEVSPIDFMRHYYDVYCLLQRPEVQTFIGTEEYKAHKTKRFRSGDNPNIAANQAFILSDPKTRKLYEDAYAGTSALYYKEKPTFEQILAEIAKWVDRL